MRSIYKRRRFNKKRASALLIVVILWATCLTAWMYFNSARPSNLVTPTIAPKTVQPRSVSSNVLFLGNTFWGRYVEDWSMASPLKYSYPFSRLNEFQRDKYDAWISGIECPIVASVHMTSAEQEQALQFNCSPNFLPEASKWFTAFTLANNHTDNQGSEGFTETKQQLEKNGIQYFGHYDPRVIDDVCEVVSLPATVTKDNGKLSKGNIPVAMCAYHGVFQIPPEESAAIIKKYSDYMPVIAMPHMGAEYQAAPDEIKTTFYRSLIDNGADMVIGDHPHWVQTSESYKGHLIVYSMGNFMFDQQGIMEMTRSAGINVVMSINDKPGVLSKWLALGGSCGRFKDDCLDKIKAQNLPKLHVIYRFGFVGTNDDKKIAKPATAEQQAGISQRLNWQSTMQGLQSPYGSL
ncbi:CapA family protein [Candidatus Saccharibacteria bacterium]|nr:CapA family protein [Candidatus Saccharibacteria bacterium]